MIPSEDFAGLYRTFAIMAGWTIKGTGTENNWVYDGVTSAADPEDQGVGGDYDIWNGNGDALRWAVFENDGRELLIAPKYNLSGFQNWLLVIYCRKGAGGFDGSVAGTGALPGPPATASDEVLLQGNNRSTWGGNGGSESGTAAYSSASAGYVHFWGHSQAENGARVLCYQADSGSSSFGCNAASTLIMPIVASSQSVDDPDPVVVKGAGNASAQLTNTRMWNYRTSAWITDVPGLPESLYFFAQTGDPLTEPTSGTLMFNQVSAGNLRTSTSSNSAEFFKGYITENAIVWGSANHASGQVFDMGWDTDGFYASMGRASPNIDTSDYLIPWPDQSTEVAGRSVIPLDGSFRGIRAEGRDATPPVVDNFSTPYALADQGDSITFDVTDISPGVDTVYVAVQYGNGLEEAAYMRSSFTQHFTNGSSTALITNGLRFTLSRNRPWLGDFTVKVYAVDFDGNDVGPVEQAYTIPARVCYVPSIPSPDSSMAIRTYTLLEYRNLAKDLADMDNSDFVSEAEWNTFINLGLRELHDLLVEAHDQEFLLKTYNFQVTPPTNTYSLPADFHVMKGVDYSDCCFAEQTVDGDPGQQDQYDVQTTESTNMVYQLRPYTFEERHQRRYAPQLHHNDRWGDGHASMRYRVFTERIIDDVNGNPTTAYFHRIRLSPVRAGYVQVWYIPLVPILANDADFVPAFGGFEEYPAIFAALHALMKEESDIGPMTLKLESLKQRIRIMAAARDVGWPGRIGDVIRRDGG